MMDKPEVAENIPKLLERRISKLICCAEGDLRCITLGALVHFLFLLDGPSEMLGGFNTSMVALLDLLGREVVWAEPTNEDSTREKMPLIQ